MDTVPRDSRCSSGPIMQSYSPTASGVSDTPIGPIPSVTRLALILLRPLSVSGNCLDPTHQVRSCPARRSALYFPPHRRQPPRDPSRVRDQYQPALRICTLNSLVGCDHLLQ